MLHPFQKLLRFYQGSPKLAKFRYTAYYERCSVKDKVVLLEAFQGDSITGNPFYLLRALCRDERFADYILYVGAKPKSVRAIRHMLDCHGMERVKVVQRHTKRYCRLLASAKYLICDVSFPPYFIKKENQILLNTWHGTPLKGLGRSIHDNPHTIGNVQRNLLMADYLLFPNRYTFDKMREDYMIGPYYTGRYVLGGYPRNDALFDAAAADALRDTLGLKGKTIAVYMPTWRESTAEEDKAYHAKVLQDTLRTLGEKTDDNTVIIAKLHHLASGSIDFSAFRNVMPFPDNCETYEVLAMADCLITDYSSVMFDFANTGRKVLLYAYDCEAYQNTRSMYFSIEKLPFVQVETADELAYEVNRCGVYPSYAQEMQPFVAFDNPHSSEALVDLVFFGRPSERMEVIKGKTYHDGKPNVLIYVGNLLKNGVTTAFMGIMENADLSPYHCLLTFYQRLVEDNKYILHRWRRDVDYLPMPDDKPLTYYEAICQYLYFHFNWNFAMLRKVVQTISERDLKRCFYGIRFDTAIHYTGYEKFMIHLIKAVEAQRIIYVHNDILQESQHRTFVHRNSIMEAYNTFEKIAVVRDSMRPEIKSYIPTAPDSRIHTAHNLNNIDYIRSRAGEPLAFDSDTWCNVPLERVQAILSDDKIYKMIDIARFSYEKGLDRLLHAFSVFTPGHPDVCLFLIGGHGNRFEEIRAMVEQSGVDNVILIKSISNPYPILNACDAFVLSSRYEGLPMTMMEALILHKPVVSTAIHGPMEFLSDNGCGLLVEDSEEGVLDGLNACFDGRLQALKPFDAEAFNQTALQEFYALLES